MRAAFFGTPAISVPSLDALASMADVRVVVTRPPKPRGRSGRPVPSPVAVRAGELGLPVETPGRAAEIGTVLEDHGPLDVGVVVAYGAILRPPALQAPAAGHVNVHFSLLPRWRGAAPVQRAIMAGDERTGVSLMRLDEGLDTGPVMAVRAGSLGLTDTAGDVAVRLAGAGADLLARVLPGYLAGGVVTVAQPGSGVTVAEKIRPEERELRFDVEPEAFVRWCHALSPSPGAFARHEGSIFKVLRAAPAEGASEPGILDVDGSRLLVGCGSGRVELIEVQPAGRSVMPGVAWARGRRGPIGGLT